MAKPKIVFFALHTVTDLKHYWPGLSQQADCCWMTTSWHVYQDLKTLGYAPVCFCDLSLKQIKPAWLGSLINKFYGRLIELIQPWATARMLDKINPDIIVSDTALRLLQYKLLRPTVMTVQVFHSVCYKYYYVNPSHMKYDLLLLPGTYHAQRLIEFFPNSECVAKPVVGWPRAEELVANPLTGGERAAVCQKLGLNPAKKTVLYAPTWNSFFNNSLFPRSFGSLEEAFEGFCRRVKEMDVNLIVKMHPATAKLIKNQRCHDIADQYGVCLTYRYPTWHIGQEVKTLLQLADILISDVSGMTMDYMVLDRPIIFIEPDHPAMSWANADIEPQYRAGVVVNSLDEIVVALRRSLDNPLEFQAKRQQTSRMVLGVLDGQSCTRAVRAILDYYPEFCLKVKDKDFMAKRAIFRERLMIKQDRI